MSRQLTPFLPVHYLPKFLRHPAVPAPLHSVAAAEVSSAVVAVAAAAEAASAAVEAASAAAAVPAAAAVSAAAAAVLSAAEIMLEVKPPAAAVVETAANFHLCHLY